MGEAQPVLTSSLQGLFEWGVVRLEGGWLWVKQGGGGGSPDN